MPSELTTVKIRKETRKMLAKLGTKDEIYDVIIRRLIDFYRKNSKESER